MYGCGLEEAPHFKIEGDQAQAAQQWIASLLTSTDLLCRDPDVTEETPAALQMTLKSDAMTIGKFF